MNFRYRFSHSQAGRLFLYFLILSFSLSGVPFPSTTYAQGLPNLPKPGSVVPLSNSFQPAVIIGLTLNQENPLLFDFVVDRGNSGLKGVILEQESEKLVKYFLTALTIPDDEVWVNLSPYEKEFVIPDALSVTEMGKDMLAQDYLLKQITASLTHPENKIGKEFWNKVFAKAQELYGTTNIPVNTFNKVWIVPDKAVVLEQGNTAFVAESHLKVMMEEDYFALIENLENKELGTDRIDQNKVEDLNSLTANLVREIIIPELEREVNEGRNFASVRQIFNSVILATWFKETLKESLLSKIYVDQNKVAGVDSEDKAIKQKIYDQYMSAFRSGVYNFVKEDFDFTKKESLPRKYFSGGLLFQPQIERRRLEDLGPQTQRRFSGMAQTIRRDEAMITRGGGAGEDPQYVNARFLLEERNVSDFFSRLRPRVRDAAIITDTVRGRERVDQRAQFSRPIELQTALDYWAGRIQTTPITRPFRATQKNDVDDITEINEEEGRSLEEIALESLLSGEGYIWDLVAGAALRMSPKVTPEDVSKMARNKEILSKAAVPIGIVDGRVITYLDAFGDNLGRLFKALDEEASGVGRESRVYQNLIGLFTNNTYRGEHERLIKEGNNYGLQPGQIRFMHQPEGYKFIARLDNELDKDEIEKARKEFKAPGSFEDAQKISKDIKDRVQEILAKGDGNALVVEDEKDPLGHGEFFHQMIESGELLNIVDSERRWLYVRNVDNTAAKFDKVWLKALGKFLSQNLDFQGEVSPRGPAQDGGSLIVMEDSKQQWFAEDPTLRATKDESGKIKVSPNDSYWFNDAAGFITPNYIINIYRKEGQINEDFIKELRQATEQQRLEIAERGRKKFPKLIGSPKKARSANIATVKLETNMWQSTNVVGPNIQVKGVGVKGAAIFPIDKFGKMTAEEKTRELAKLRFLSTKNWDKPEIDKEKTKKKYALEEGKKVEEISDARVGLAMETYAGNRVLMPDLLDYIYHHPSLFTAGLIKPKAKDQALITSVQGRHFNPQLDFRQKRPLSDKEKRAIQDRIKRNPSQVREILEAAKREGIKLTITGHLRGLDGPGSSLDLPEFQKILTKLGARGLDNLPSTPTIASEFTATVEFELADDPDEIVYVAPDYKYPKDYHIEEYRGKPIDETRPYRVVEPVKLVKGRTPYKQTDGPAFIFRNVFGLSGIKITMKSIPPIAQAGGMESSNVFNVALIAAASMLSGANLSQAEIFNLAVKLENHELSGLTGGQGHLATLLGGAQKHIWLSGVKRRQGEYINPYSAVSIPLVTEEQLVEIEKRLMLVQAGLKYKKGEKDIERTAALINYMWTDLLRDQDEIGYPLHVEKLELTNRFTKALQEGKFEEAAKTIIRYVEIRDTLVNRWLNLMLDAHLGKPLPENTQKYAKRYASKVFNPRNNYYKAFAPIKKIFDEQGEAALRQRRFYTDGPIANLVEAGKKEGIAIMPLGAGGPGSNLIALDPKGLENLKRFLEEQKISEIKRKDEAEIREIMSGGRDGELKGFIPFKTGKEPMRFDGFDRLKSKVGADVELPQAPEVTTVTAENVRLDRFSLAAKRMVNDFLKRPEAKGFTDAVVGKQMEGETGAKAVSVEVLGELAQLNPEDTILGTRIKKKEITQEPEVNLRKIKDKEPIEKFSKLVVARMEAKKKPKPTDEAMLTRGPTTGLKPDKLGGIDFNPKLLDLKIKRDDKGVPLPLPMQDVQTINIDGLFPVIINITPASFQNLPFLLNMIKDDELKMTRN